MRLAASARRAGGVLPAHCSTLLPGPLASCVAAPARGLSTREPLRSLSNTPGAALPGYNKPHKVRRTFEQAAQEAMKRAGDKPGSAAASNGADGPAAAASLAGRVLSAVSEDYYQPPPLNFNPAVAAAFAAAEAAPSAAPAAAAGSAASPLTLASEIVWLYRTTLRHVRVLDNEIRRAEARQEARANFRALRGMAAAVEGGGAIATAASSGAAAASAPSTSAAAAATSVSDVRAKIASAYSKLSFLRMATPKLRQPRIAHVPPYEGAIKLFGASRGPAVYAAGDGRTLSPEERARALLDSSTVGGRTVINSQGITGDQVRRHQALVDRMHFRGPRWAGKPR